MVPPEEITQAEVERLFLREVTDFAIIGLNASGTVITWNRGAEAIFGFAADEVIGKNFSFIFVPEDLESGVPERELRRAAAEGRADDIRWHQRKDGTRLFVDGVTTALHREGALVGFCKISRNVTERKATETQLHAQNAVALVLAGSQTIEEASEVVIRTICRELRWAVGQVWLSDGLRLTCSATWGDPALSGRGLDALCLNEPLVGAEGLPGRVAVSGRAEWIEDIGTESRFPRAAAAVAAGLKSVLAFPLALPDHTLGVIELFSTRVRSRDARMLELSEALGANIAQFLERKRAEAALVESEKRYRAVAETASDAIFTIDDQRRIDYINPAGAEIFGYGREELIGKSVEILMPPRLRREYGRRLGGYLETQTPRGREIEFIGMHRTGVEIPLEVSFSEIESEEGPRFTAIARDISERKKAEAEIREANERVKRLQSVTDVALSHLDVEDLLREMMGRICLFMRCDTAAVLLVDAQGQLAVRATSRLEEEVELDVRIPIGGGFAGRVAAERSAMIVNDPSESEIISPVLRGKGVRSLAGAPLETKQRLLGVIHVGSMRSHAFDEDDLEFLRLVAERLSIAIENAELYEFEREARQRAAFLSRASKILSSSLDYDAQLQHLARLAVPEIGDWCAVDIVQEDGSLERLAVEHVDPERRMLAVELHARYPSPVVARVVATGRPELFSSFDRKVMEAISRDEEHRTLLRRIGLRSAMIVPLSVPGRTFGAILLARSETARPYSSDDLDFAQDLARRAALSIENARLYAEAQEANRAKDQFLATVSHELRTPMTAILGWIKLLRMGTDEETTEEGLEAIDRSASAQAQLIEDILDLSRITTGKLHYRLDPVSLPAIVESAVDTVRVNAETKGVELHAEIDRSLPPVMGDPTRLQQIIWNLLTNAIKFTASGGRVDVRLDHRGECARITVHDTGEGIPPEFLPLLFKRFTQAEGSLRRAHGGLGLGLSIVRHLVELHGGTVRAESEGRGRGSTFVIEIPFAQKKEMVSEFGAQPRREGSGAPLQGVRVLIVEDDADTLAYIATVLERAGADVVRALSVSDAIERSADEWADVVVSDLAMPGASGYDLIRLIRTHDRERRSRTPVLAVTASGTAGDAQQALSAGFDRYIRKPVEPAVLLDAVIDLVDGASQG